MYNYYYIKCSKEHRADLELKTYTKRSEEWLQNYLDTRLGKDIEVYVEKAEGSLPKIKNVAPDKLVSFIKSTYGQPKVPKRTINTIFKEEIDKCNEVLYAIISGKVYMEVLYDGGLGKQKPGITIIKGISYDLLKEYPFVRETRFGDPFVKGQMTFTEFVDYVEKRRNVLIGLSRK
jgi:hypothetical protein